MLLVVDTIFILDSWIHLSQLAHFCRIKLHKDFSLYTELNLNCNLRTFIAQVYQKSQSKVILRLYFNQHGKFEVQKRELSKGVQ